eukprot:5170-Eustigmatos_ZCMA.PRE.1
MLNSVFHLSYGAEVTLLDLYSTPYIQVHVSGGAPRASYGPVPTGRERAYSPARAVADVAAAAAGLPQ